MKLRQFLSDGYLEALIGGNALVESPLRDELYRGENIISIRFCGTCIHFKMENREIRSLSSDVVYPYGVYGPVSAMVEWRVRPKDLDEEVDIEAEDISFDKFDGGRCVFMKAKVG